MTLDYHVNHVSSKLSSGINVLREMSKTKLPYSGTDDGVLRSYLSTLFLQSGLERGMHKLELLYKFSNFKKEKSENSKVDNRADQISKLLNCWPCPVSTFWQTFFLGCDIHSCNTRGRENYQTGRQKWLLSVCLLRFDLDSSKNVQS